MMKKFALVAVAAAALGCASAAHAGYTTTFTGFSGDFVIKGFGIDVGSSQFNPSGYTVPDQDSSFSIALTNLEGKVSFQVPSDGNYSAQALPGFVATIDYDGKLNTDLGVFYPTGATLGSGFLSVGGTNANLVEFNFNGANATTYSIDGVANNPPYNGGAITLSGFGATTFLASLFGLNSFMGAASGNVNVTYSIGQDSMNVTIDESNLVTTSGRKFQDIFLALDNGLTGIPLVPAGNKNGIIDGTFGVNGSVHIPEPGSLALLGLGLVGLAAHRRKALKTRKAA